MAYSVKQVAKLSGVSVRTLHHYDAIGLLKPAYHGANGYRYYEEEDLLRLQQILFLKELGIELKRVKVILAQSDQDRLKALRSHKVFLEQEIARLGELIQTIDKTMQHLNKERKMSEHDMYRGFSKERQAQYEQQLLNMLGEVAEKPIAEAERNTKTWKDADYAKAAKAMAELNRELVAAVDSGLSPGSPQVQDLVARHYDWVKQFWTPDREGYKGLAALYGEHADFKERLDAVDVRLLPFLAKAMTSYANRQL